MTEKPQDDKYIKAIKVQNDGKPCAGYEERKKYVHDPNTISKSFLVIESYNKKALRSSMNKPISSNNRDVPKVFSSKKIPEQDNFKRKEKILSLINKYGITDSLLEAITEMKGGPIPGKRSQREVPKSIHDNTGANVEPPVAINKPPAPNDHSRIRNETLKNDRNYTAYIPSAPLDKHYCHKNCTCPEDEFRKDNDRIKSERQQRQGIMSRTNSLSRFNNTLYDRNPRYYLEVMNRIERSSSPSRPQTLSVRSPSPMRAQTTTITNTGRRMPCVEIDSGRRSLSRMDEVRMARNCQFCDFCNKHFHEDCFNKTLGNNERMK